VGEDPRIKAWKEQFSVFDVTLEQGIEAALGIFAERQKVKDSKLVSELLPLWEHEKLNSRLKPLRQRSKQTIRAMGATFKADLGSYRIKEVTSEVAEKYLHDKNVSNQTKRNLRSYLGQFFNWCIKKSFHNQNPVASIEIHVERTTPQYFSSEHCGAIIKAAEANDMIGYFALCLFAGIRPKEVERMTWKNVNLETKEIHLTANITKTKRDRLFRMSDNLAVWLSTLDQEKPLINTNHKKQRAKVIKALKSQKIQWIDDGLRHSFATYHYAKNKSLEELGHVMGNSPEIITRFYKGAVPEKQVSDFWGILPQSYLEQMDNEARQEAEELSNCGRAVKEDGQWIPVMEVRDEEPGVFE
jgi:integrase